MLSKWMPAALALTFSTPLVSTAQDTPSAVPAATPAATAVPVAEPPKPGPEMAKLQFLVGDWVHEEIDRTAPAGPGARRAARSRIGWILAAQRLYITYKSVGTSGEYEGRGLIGWDPEAKAYRLDWFDSRGLGQRYEGGFDPEETLVFSGEFKAEGERHRQQMAIKKQPGNKFLLTDSLAVGEGPMKVTLESLAQTAPVPTPTPTPAPAATPPGGAPAGPTPTPSPTPTPAK
jgi:hypothetical protein